jgi:hypothetical protein
MNADVRAMLNETEQALLRSTEGRAMKTLDEDALAVLHDRVRRARNKYSKLYRRRASAQVASDRTRARAHAANVRAARKAELFEDALARVSRRLAKLAEASAEALKAERLAAARGATDGADAPPTPRRAKSARGTKAGSKAKKAEKKARTPASEKRRASTKASGKRAQAKRDRRG